MMPRASKLGASHPPSRALASTHRRDFTVINAPVRPAWAIIGFPLVFDAEFLELCPNRRKPTLEDNDDLVANLGRREGGSGLGQRRCDQRGGAPRPGLSVQAAPDQAGETG